MNNVKNDKIRQQVRETYANVAKSTTEKFSCGPSCCGSKDVSPQTISSQLGYSDNEMASVPEGADMGLGCGNPQAIANLKPGETVLDLGSGGGFDCFIAARQVGKNGFSIGVDMTPDMISKSRKNASECGYDNVVFRLGEIEYLPIADKTVDVIMSNCVINLSPDKQQVFNDCYRVLRAGGRLAISDIIAIAEIPSKIKEDMAVYSGCVAGASKVEDLKEMLIQAGFSKVSIEIKEESKEFIKEWFPGSGAEKYVVSAIIEAEKPLCCC